MSHSVFSVVILFLNLQSSVLQPFSKRKTLPDKPFWPQAARFAEITVNNNPGPGRYFISLIPSGDPNSPKRGVLWCSPKVRRIRIPRIPAPNAYNLDGISSPRKKEFNKCTCSRAFHKNIAEKLPEEFHLPAPCDYQEPTIDLTGVVFHSTSKRHVFTPADKDPIPGPGAYQMDRFPKQPITREPIKLKSKFTTVVHTLSDDIVHHPPVPGPGTYNLRRGLVTPSFMSTAPFLSNVPRWLAPNCPIGLGIGDMANGPGASVSCPGGRDAFTIPGPTTYNPTIPGRASFHDKYHRTWM
ncbi:hypothetical protein D915_006433 [Fasciola hepatica]|uniref:Outer dense fiber protein 3 n=1 Tax=Fasciola hepatica TaxID=6192 RepID=A0A4E0R402_FASHE|nr:hypothetical protein D915_006433 [Fasciola hepatica]